MMEIVTGKDSPILRKKCKPVEVFDKNLEDIIAEMEDTMLGDQEGGVTGIGLAANQVGIDARIILITLNVNTKKDMVVLPMINPEILELSKDQITYEEGCLSLPNTFGNVRRPSKVKVKWQNLQGNWCEKKFEKWDARIFLHEYDHIEGKLFIDYLEK